MRPLEFIIGSAVLAGYFFCILAGFSLLGSVFGLR